MFKLAVSIALFLTLSPAVLCGQIDGTELLHGRWDCRNTGGIRIAMEFKPSGTLLATRDNTETKSVRYSVSNGRLFSDLDSKTGDPFRFEGNQLLIDISDQPGVRLFCSPPRPALQGARKVGTKKDERSGTEVLTQLAQERVSCVNCPCAGVALMDEAELKGYWQYRQVTATFVPQGLSPAETANGVQEKWTARVRAATGREYSRKTLHWEPWNTFNAGTIFAAIAIKTNGVWRTDIDNSTQLGANPLFTFKGAACAQMPE